MAHDYANTADELTLEPIDLTFREERIFGDFSSRDRKPKGRAARAEKPAAAESPKKKQKASGRAAKKPAGKANFLSDDRKAPDRRRGDRRSWVRLTGDRRTGPNRRSRTDPWEREFRK